jgi:hypothetical protein
MSADRFRQAAKANDSGSWNKYSYTRGDPVNRTDLSGRFDCPPDSNTSVCVSDGEGGGDGGLGYCDVNPSDPSCGGSGPTHANQGGPGGISSSESKTGLANAKAALASLTTASLDSDNCQQDLTALSAAAGRSITASAIHGVAAQAENYLYDGPSSNTPWNTTSFGDGNGSATVGQYFQTKEGVDGLSQSDGYAIWIVSPAWANRGTTPYTQAFFLHEILHKFSLTDIQIGTVLFGRGYNLIDDGTSKFKPKLKADCFSKQ